MMPIVVVSGWAMSAEVMAPLVDALREQNCPVTVMSLTDAPEQNWEDLLTTLAQKIDNQRSILIGWSLGGNLCMRFAARYPQLISHVVTLGSTPCFVATDNWCYGKPELEFQAFTKAVKNDIAAAIKGFIPVCATGSPDTKGTIRLLRQTLPWALAHKDIWPGLLNRLADDARSEWQKVICPSTHFLATHDPLAKVTINKDLALLLPNATIHTVDGSHTIFADHTKSLVEILLAVMTGAVVMEKAEIEGNP